MTVPSWRATKDISIKDDLVEEVGRMIGYDSITPHAASGPGGASAGNRARLSTHRFRDRCDQGFTRSTTIPSSAKKPCAIRARSRRSRPRAEPDRVGSGAAATILLPGIWRNIVENSQHLDEFRLFEIGNEIHKRAGGLPDEVPHLAACVFARAGDGSAQLMEAKRLAECLLPGATAERPAAARPFEHPTRAYWIMWRGQPVGRLFEFHPNIVDGRAAVLDLDLRAIQALGESQAYTPLRRYPTSAFDLSSSCPCEHQ